ncbi:MAG: Uma2 family endonuclease [Microcoleus sp. SU_5_6]|nr:Uma2 family endonuclease [Microcoleus sp. SU_5_6]
MKAIAKPSFTFEEYLTYNDGTDNRYELVDGELVLMNPPTGRHALVIRNISNCLEAEIHRLGIPWVTLQMFGVRTAPRRSRLPDLCVTTLERAKELLDVSAVLELGALLVVEVVSPDSVKTDYRYKRTEYAAAGIPEYWVVDPIAKKVTVLQFVDGLYEEKEYQGSSPIKSELFPELTVTADQIFQI